MRFVRGLLGWGLAAAFLLSGCSPSRFVANRIVKAPNSYPTWFAPEPRVYLGYQAKITDQLQLEAILANWSRFFTNGPAVPTIHFQSETNGGLTPETIARYAKDPARIVFRVVPPAAYHLKVTATNWTEGGQEKAEFDFRRDIPAAPIPGLIRPLGTVVLLHGYGLDHESMLPWAFWFGERGWQALLVDLRGHGRSTGKAISFGPIEVAELQTLLSQLESQGRVTSPVIAMGVSYGATLALRWTASDPRVTSAIAIAPYARLGDAIENIRRDFASWVPASVINAGVRRIPEVVGVHPADLDTLHAISGRSVRALLMAGGSDVIAPVAEVDALHRACAPGSRLWVLEGSNHEALPFRFNQLAPAVERWITPTDFRQERSRGGSHPSSEHGSRQSGGFPNPAGDSGQF